MNSNIVSNLANNENNDEEEEDWIVNLEWKWRKRRRRWTKERVVSILERWF